MAMIFVPTMVKQKLKRLSLSFLPGSSLLGNIHPSPKVEWLRQMKQLYFSKWTPYSGQKSKESERFPCIMEKILIKSWQNCAHFYLILAWGGGSSQIIEIIQSRSVGNWEPQGEGPCTNSGLLILNPELVYHANISFSQMQASVHLHTLTNTHKGRHAGVINTSRDRYSWKISVIK